ncbi:MAG: sortase B protein-sorting domain-containing protein [Candidatus Ventricola sp.]
MPQTGDSSQLTLWLLLAIASAAVLAAVYCRRRRR